MPQKQTAKPKDHLLPLERACHDRARSGTSKVGLMLSGATLRGLITMHLLR